MNRCNRSPLKSPFRQSLALLLTLLSLPAQAMDSTDLLPAGVNSPAFRYGIVSGVDSKYTNDGSVASLNDINTIEFNSEQLVKISPEITTLVNILNQFSQQQLGSQISLGTLRIETVPEVRYKVPIYARGITDDITIGIALPIVSYKNKLSLNQSASNAKAICAQFQGIQLPEIEDACRQLDIKITDAVRDELAKKGYKPIKDRDETILTDLQLVGFWKMHDNKNSKTSAYLRTTLNLPTGPANDPDDLADLGASGNTSAEEQLMLNYLPFKWLRIAANASYKWSVPDKAEMRVPGSPGDFLPGPESKEKVSRDVGDTVSTGIALTGYIGDLFSVAGGYQVSRKFADKYDGTRGLRYDLLSKDTASVSHKLRAALGFDTIAIYQRTKKFPPLKLDFEVTNSFAGTNSDRQLVNEFSLTLFF
jgi:hypothetical protein